MKKQQIYSYYNQQDINLLNNYKQKTLKSNKTTNFSLTDLYQMANIKQIIQIGQELIKKQNLDDPDWIGNQFEFDIKSVAQSENIILKSYTNNKQSRICNTEKYYSQKNHQYQYNQIKNKNIQTKQHQKYQNINKMNNKQIYDQIRFIKTQNPQFQSLKVSKQKTPQLLRSRSFIDNYFQVSQYLLKPVKNLKRKTIQQLNEKKRIQSEQLIRIEQNKNRIKIEQFYKNNKNHKPLYEKAKQSQIKKTIKQQQSRISLLNNQLNQSRFYPQINQKTKRIVQGTQFYQRLETEKIKRKENKFKIISQVLQKTPFKPKINQKSNIQAQSKIKSIWNGSKSLSTLNLKQFIYEQQIQDEEIDINPEKRMQMQKYLTLTLNASDSKLFFE